MRKLSLEATKRRFGTSWDRDVSIRITGILDFRTNGYRGWSVYAIGYGKNGVFIPIK